MFRALPRRLTRPEPLVPRALRAAPAACMAVLLLVGVLSEPRVAGATPPDLPPMNADAATLRTDARAVLLNPANLALNPGLHLALDFGDRLESNAPAGQHLAAYGGWGSGRGFGVGLATVADLDPGSAFTTTLGFAAGRPEATLGFSRSFYGGRGDNPWDGQGSTTLSLTGRSTPHLGTTHRVRHLERPRIGGVALQREWLAAAAARTTRGALGAEVGWLADENAVRQGALVAHVRARPFDLLRVFLGAQVGEPDRSRSALQGGWRTHAGVELVLGPSTTAAGVHVASPEGSPRGSRLVASVEAHTPPRPSRQRTPGVMLEIELAGPTPEQPRGGLFTARSEGFTTLLADLDRVARERRVAGLYLILDNPGIGPAQAWELAEMLDRVRASDRKVVVEWRDGGLTELFLAAHADRVVVPPSMAMARSGVGSTAIHLRELLDRLGVEPQFERIGDWKTAPDQLQRRAPSDEERAQVQAWLDTIWQVFTERIAERRNVGLQALVTLLGDAPLTAAELERAGLVDARLHLHQIDGWLQRDVIGRPVTLKTPREHWREREAEWLPRRRVAVVHIGGLIAPGESLPEGLFQGVVTGDLGIARAVAEILQDPTWGAVIVRVSSGGGSVLASDEIRASLLRLSREMPVYVSFGDVAASGGYWVATLPGVPVVAAPPTLTGSIGIFAGALDITGLLDRLGIHRERFEAGGRSTLFGTFPWTDAERAAVRRLIQDGYDRFVALVMESRGLSRDEAIARSEGRIFSGREALALGLVDTAEAGFPDAMDAVRARLGLGERDALILGHFPDARPGLGGGLVAAAVNAGGTAEAVPARWIQAMGGAGMGEALDVAWLMSRSPGQPLALLPWLLASGR